MNNINELIGIIKAVDFDGIINEQEIDCMRNWVEYNRNLAYEKEEAKLIELVDDVIADNVITEDEKEALLDVCDVLQKQAIEERIRIHELNGIVEGIICDEKVNEIEIASLKKWMEDNKGVIKKYRIVEELFELIDDILEDGIVSESEHKILLQKLFHMTNRSKFDTKLEYLKKMVRAGENVGIELIDLLDDEIALDEIHDLAERFLIMSMGRYSKSTVDSEIVFISLTLIGMVYYDGNFYENVRTTYKRLYSLYPNTTIEGYIRSVLKRYGLENNFERRTSRYINIALHNAIVPSCFLKSFFDFIYDIYCLNFEYSLPENLYEEFEFVYDGLRNSMKSDNDELELNATKKTYKLIKTTKELIADKFGVEQVINLSIIIVKLIDNYVRNKGTNVYNLYMKDAYLEWVNQYECQKDEVKKNSSTVSRCQPKLKLKNESVYILPLVHKIKTDHYYDLQVVIYNNDVELVKIKNPYVEEIMGGYKVKVDSIKISKPIGKIKYKVLQGERIVYDSQDKLYREYIMFNDNGEEIKNNSEYSGTAILVTDKEVKDFSTFAVKAEYFLASRNVLVGEAYNIHGAIFNFSELFKPGIFGNHYENHYLIDEASGKKLKVYKSVNYLMFENIMENAEYYITIDERREAIEYWGNTVSCREGVEKHVVSIDIQSPGIHKILVEKKVNERSQRIFGYEFVFDPMLETDMTKLDDNTYTVTIRSGLGNTFINKKVCASDFDEDGIEFEFAGKKYKYRIPFEFDFYRISGQPWKSLHKGIWIGDISHDSVLDICGNSIDAVIAYPCGSQPLNDFAKIRNRGVYQQIPVGFLVSYKTNSLYTMLVFVTNGKAKRAVCCDNCCNLIKHETLIKYNTVDRLLSVIPRYNGEGNVFIKLSKSNGEEVERSGIIANQERIDFTNIESFENYKIGIYEKTKGLALGKKERLMHEFERVFCADDDFIGKKFKVFEVTYVEDGKNGYVRKRAKIQDTYIRFSGKNQDGSYSGDIREGIKMMITSLRKVNPICIRLDNEPSNNQIDINVIGNENSSIRFNVRENGIYNGDNIYLPEITNMKIKLTKVEG